MYFLASEEGSSNILRMPLDEVIIGTVAFLIVFGVLAKLVLPKLAKTLDERAEQIEGGLKRAETAQAEAQQALEGYTAQLAEARQEAARMRETAREEGAQIVAEMREQAQAEARRIVEAAQVQIESERQQAVNQIRAEIGTLSVELAGRVVGESLEDEARRSRTVDRFLEELEERTGARSGEQVR